MFTETVSCLQLIDIDKLRFHEEREVSRLDKLIKKLNDCQHLNNPPLAIALKDDYFLVIDGAHRVAALDRMGCRRVPVQVVKLDQLQLDFWNHEIPNGYWIEKIQKEKRVSFEGGKNFSHYLCSISYSKGQQIEVYSQSEDKFLSDWNYIVKSYSEEYSVNRLASWNTQLINKENVIVKFKPISLEFIKQIVINNGILPAGVTRFNIKGRLLNLRIPLGLLFNDILDVKLWNDLNNNWVNNLRFYEDTVYIYE